MTAAIETVGLTKTYGKNRGIQELSLVVQPGEVFGFLGPNGAGKTTTIRALAGLQRPSDGVARVLGYDCWAQAVEVHRHFGYLPGELKLFEAMTGSQHLSWFSRARGIDDPPGLADLLRRFELVLDRPVGDLSTGNRQKLGIVLAFMHRPRVLILDEPTSGLDPLMQEVFHHLVREAVDEGRTVFLSSHELDEVQRLADRVAIIREGRLVVTDTVEHLRAGAPRIIEVTLKRRVASRALAGLDGVRVITSNGRRCTVELTGAIGPFLRVVADLDPVDLTARRADLDELFLQYYREGRPAGVG